MRGLQVNMDLYEELHSLVKTFNENNLGFAICGGIAVAFHGYSRFTKDIDFIVEERVLDKLMDIVQKMDYKFISGPFTFDANSPNERTVHRISKVAGEDVRTKEC